MFEPLNGPAEFGDLDVTTSAKEVKVGASPLVERKVVTVQPIDGEVFYGYDNTVTIDNGTKIAQGQFFPFEASEDLRVWLIAASGTVDVRITEVS